MKLSVVIPNWNGADELPACLDSLRAQSQQHQIIVVENGSTDNSKEILHSRYPDVTVIPLPFNTGFAGGVNAGLRYAAEAGHDYTALLNNDAIADKNWLKNLVEAMEASPKAGIVTSKMINDTGEHLDSTGEMYTIWGLPYPRGRGEAVSDKYDDQTDVFGASGGASLFRIKMLNEIGLFDENFFAYYEDVDLSFRAQLAGWKVAYAPEAIVYHQIGATSGKVKGFVTYQTLKNLPLIFWKDVPFGLMPTVLPRITLAGTSFFFSAVARGQGWPALKGVLCACALIPKKLVERRKIQKNCKVSLDYIRSLIVYDLPPEAHKLRSLRKNWQKLWSKKA